jgi:hypothetical protein
VPLTSINGNDGTADITLNAKKYALQLGEWEIDLNYQLFDSSNFANEGSIVEESGAMQAGFRYAGTMKKEGRSTGAITFAWVRA